MFWGRSPGSCDGRLDAKITRMEISAIASNNLLAAFFREKNGFHPKTIFGETVRSFQFFVE